MGSAQNPALTLTPASDPGSGVPDLGHGARPRGRRAFLRTMRRAVLTSEETRVAASRARETVLKALRVRRPSDTKTSPLVAKKRKSYAPMCSTQGGGLVIHRRGGAFYQPCQGRSTRCSALEGHRTMAVFTLVTRGHIFDAGVKVKH